MMLLTAKKMFGLIQHQQLLLLVYGIFRTLSVYLPFGKKQCFVCVHLTLPLLFILNPCTNMVGSASSLMLQVDPLSGLAGQVIGC